MKDLTKLSTVSFCYEEILHFAQNDERVVTARSS